MIKMVNYFGLTGKTAVDGRQILQGIWKVCSDVNSEKTAYQEVVEWSGAVGDAFRFPDENSTGYINEPSILVCDIEIENCGDNFTYQVIFSGRTKLLEPLVLGEIKLSHNESGIAIKNIRYFVPALEVETFTSRLKIGEVAEWAGDNFYLESFKTESESISGKIFVLSAKSVSKHMLNCNRSEKFAGFGVGGLINRETIYQATYQAHKDDLESFQNLTGTSAGDWAGGDTVITKVEPRKISDFEYQVMLEAQERSNPELYLKYKVQNFTSLSHQREVNITLRDYHLTCSNCGYVQLPDGTFEELQDWNSDLQCPLMTSAALPKNLINSMLRLIQIKESTYYQKSIAGNINTMIEWGSQRVFYGRVAGHSGSYLRHDMSAEEVFDNAGRRWTKFNCIYTLAPPDYQWNNNYWKNK